MHMSNLAALTKFPSLSKLSSGYFHRVKEDPKYVRITFRKSSDFVPESVSQVILDKEAGITAIVGIVKAKKLQCAASAIRFPKSQFTVEKAQQWVAEHFSINND